MLIYPRKKLEFERLMTMTSLNHNFVFCFIRYCADCQVLDIFISYYFFKFYKLEYSIAKYPQ